MPISKSADFGKNHVKNAFSARPFTCFWHFVYFFFFFYIYIRIHARAEGFFAPVKKKKNKPLLVGAYLQQVAELLD